jgi:HEAT repeat protein
LTSADESSDDAAEAELIRRGFTKMQLDLARRLFDPNPEVRKRLVQELPGLQGVDAVPWLMELCRDAETEVRLAAIAFLATSSDPAVLDEVERMAGRDSDSGIRRIADRIAQQRNARR